MDIFDSKSITPMLIGKNQPPFDSPDYIFEVKLDGIRCLAYIDVNGLELRNKRNKKLNAIYPELSGIFKQVNSKCILDGELVVMAGGKPDFYELQRRSLMANPTRIALAAERKPVSFTAYDILYIIDKDITGLPLMERKAMLAGAINETPELAVSRFIEANGTALYKAAAEQNLEGVIGKKKGSKYYCGKTTKDWIKIKALLDEDFAVCGYYFKTDSLLSVILGAYSDGKLIYQGHVAMGVSRHDYKHMAAVAQCDKADYPSFPIFDGARWIKPVLSCRVEYMDRTPAGRLRQPVFRGLRDDKSPDECIVQRHEPMEQFASRGLWRFVLHQ